MDEPTHNLDPEAAAALADRVKNCGVPIVSHDPCFGGRVAEKVCAVERGAVAQAESFDSYHGCVPHSENVFLAFFVWACRALNGPKR
jgi:ATPase subunit of ABC transporter with duplicated ATPase domains